MGVSVTPLTYLHTNTLFEELGSILGCMAHKWIKFEYCKWMWSELKNKNPNSWLKIWIFAHLKSKNPKYKAIQISETNRFLNCFHPKLKNPNQLALQINKMNKESKLKGKHTPLISEKAFIDQADSELSQELVHHCKATNTNLFQISFPQIHFCESCH